MEVNEDGISASEQKTREILIGIKKTPEEANRALNELFKVDIPNSEKPIEKLLLASESSTKKQLLVDAVRRLGIEIVSPNIKTVTLEEKYREILQKLGTPASKYAPRMSAHKLHQFMSALQNDESAISLDTIVWTDDGQILEKPKTVDEARETIIKVANADNAVNLIYVSDGVTFVTMSKNGTPIIWRGSAEIVLMLKKLTKKEVDDYLEQQGDLVLEIAGGIDYASEAGRKLINFNTEAPFIIDTGKVGPMRSLTDTVESDADFGTAVMIADAASSVLNSYFKGVPTHLVQGILRNFSSKENK